MSKTGFIYQIGKKYHMSGSGNLSPQQQKGLEEAGISAGAN